MPRLRAFPIALEGGLQDSKAIPEVGDLSKLENFALFRGRFALRAPFVETCQLVSDNVTPAGIDQVMAATYFQGKMYVVGYSDAEDDVFLYRLEPDGKAESGDPEYPNASPIGTIWSSVTTTLPIPIIVGFQGGAIAAQTNTLFIADYDQNFVTRTVDDPAGTPVFADLTADFDGDGGTLEDVYFHYVIPYQFHLWGAGMYDNAANDFPTTSKPRPELLRFSQPGLVARDDPDNANDTTSEWWINDWRGIGSRGDKITCMAVAGPSLIVFKRRECYQIQGYDANSWGLHVLSVRVGAVGPYSACSTDDGFCYFWSEKGPHVITPSGEVVDIGEDIRKRVAEAGIDDVTSCEYSADDGIVYFTRNVGEAAAPNFYLAYDHRRQKWTEGQWLANSTNPVLINNLVAIPSEALAGPAGPPTGFNLTRQSDTEMDLAWTNGDTSLGTVTEIYRDTADMADPPPVGKLHDTVVAGVDTYNDDGSGAQGAMSENTRYYYAIRHVRNNQSTTTAEDDDYTKLKAPYSVSCSGKSDGITIQGIRGSAVSNIDVTIQRRLLPSGNFADLTTLTSAPSIWSHDDTTCTCSSDYEYRARCEETTGGDPPYDSNYSNTAGKECCLPPLAVSNCDHDLSPPPGGTCPDPDNVTVTFTVSGAESGDEFKLYRSSQKTQGVPSYSQRDGGSVSNGQNTKYDTYGVLSGSETYYLQYKIELWAGGTTLVDSCETTEETLTLGEQEGEEIQCPE